MAVVSAAVCSLPPAKEVGETFVDLAVTACVIPPRRRFCRLPPPLFPLLSLLSLLSLPSSRSHPDVITALLLPLSLAAHASPPAAAALPSPPPPSLSLPHLVFFNATQFRKLFGTKLQALNLCNCVRRC